VSPNFSQFKDLMISCHFHDYDTIMPLVPLLYMLITLLFSYLQEVEFSGGGVNLG